MTAAYPRQSQLGFTLVELIVSIVVIAVAVTGVLLAIQFTTMHSADSVIRQQAVAIADAYMEEIMLQRYEDPTQVETLGSETGEARSTFDDVYDYNGLNEDPTDQTNDPLSDLKNYQVSVVVTNSTDFGPSNNTTAAEITITVSHQYADVKFPLTGYKANY